MQHRKIGSHGPNFSAIGIGAMSFSNFYGATTVENSHAILDAAMELGVSHIDTANVYGMGGSEAAIGSFLKARGAEAQDFFTIATKATITRDAAGNRCFDNSLEHLEAELDKSLARLGVDCVDLFYAHRRDPRMEIEEATENLAALVKKGKTKAIGFSEIAPSSLRRAVAVHPVAAVQSEYSLSVRSPEMGLVQTCDELDTALVAFSPVGRSFLTDNPLTLAAVQQVGGWIASNPRFIEPNYSANIAASEAFRALAAEMDVPAAGLAIAWLLHRGGHVVPIPGTRSVAHFQELVKGVEITLSADDITRIETALPIGWAHGDRYSADQWVGPERYC